tara:strand:+ start:140 stop:700 length:561 start_codon:yes stop_codon:yes gene_type:complete
MNTLVGLAEALAASTSAIQGLKDLKDLKTKLKKCKTTKEILKVVWSDIKANKGTFELVPDEETGGIKLEITIDSSGSDLGMAVEHIQALVDAGNAVMAGVPDLITQIKAAIEVAQAFPEKAKGAAEAAGLEGMDLMYAIKNTGTNLKQVTTVPGTAVGVKDTVVDLFTLIKGLVAGDLSESEYVKK